MKYGQQTSYNPGELVLIKGWTTNRILDVFEVLEMDSQGYVLRYMTGIVGFGNTNVTCITVAEMKPAIKGNILTYAKSQIERCVNDWVALFFGLKPDEQIKRRDEKIAKLTLVVQQYEPDYVAPLPEQHAPANLTTDNLLNLFSEFSEISPEKALEVFLKINAKNIEDKANGKL